MGTHVCRALLFQEADIDLGIEDRIEVIERLLCSLVPEEQRKNVERDVLDKKRGDADLEKLKIQRKWLQDLLQKISDVRSKLTTFIERDTVYRKGYDVYVVRDGETLRCSRPYGMLKLQNEARAAGLKYGTDLGDTKLLEKRLEDWYALFATDEIVELNVKAGELSRDEVKALIEDLEERLERFHAGYPDAIVGGEGSTDEDGGSDEEGEC